MTGQKQTKEDDKVRTLRQKLEELDAEKAAAGSYLSYLPPHGPVTEVFNGPDPAKAIDEILDSYANR